jgi:hypothetical protein
MRASICKFCITETINKQRIAAMPDNVSARSRAGAKACDATAGALTERTDIDRDQTRERAVRMKERARVDNRELFDRNGPATAVVFFLASYR